MHLSRLGVASGLTAVALVLVAALSWRELASDPARAAGEAMAVDCDASTAGIDTDCTYDSGETFDIAVHVTNAGSGYIAYQAKVQWTDAALNYLPAAVAASENVWPVTCTGIHTDNQPLDPSVFYGCLQFVLPPAMPVLSAHVGAVLQLEMECQAGTTSVDLISNAEDTQGGSQLFAEGDIPIDPALTPADVTCLEPTPTATETPAPTETPTATPSECLLRVAPALGGTSVGETGSFDVEAAQCEDVAGVAFRVNFDPAVLRIDARTAGPAFPAGCGVQVDTINNGSGFVDFGCITVPLAGSNGGGLVARYSLTCLAEGTSALTLKDTEVVDSLAQTLPHDLSGASFVCSGDGTETPTPTVTSTATATATRTPTAAATATATRTPTAAGGATATATRTPTTTATRTPTTTPTVTATPTRTATPPPTASAPPTQTPTQTPAPTVTPTPVRLCGDVDNSGEASAIDAALVLQLGAELISSLPNQPGGDVDGDGEITSVDATLILQFDAALVDELTC